jgi:uncharacterized integral membrane protein
MKTKKEIQLAKQDFLKIFREKKYAEIPHEIFIPYDPYNHYTSQKWSIVGGLTSTIIFIYLLYNALIVDSIYYWHIDLPVIVGLLVVSIFSVFAFFFFVRYRQLDKILKDFIANPELSNYGSILTKEYYFELTPEAYHIIPQENILRVDYEEVRSEEEVYLELLIESADQIEVRGVVYNPKEIDLKKWAEAA